MFQCIRQQSRLFASLFIVPLVLWTCLLQFGSANELAKYHVILLGIPVRISLALEGFSLGCIHGLISIMIACLLFNIFSNWAYLRAHPVLYAFCWLFPFCGMALFGWAMSAGMPGAFPPPTPAQRTISGWEGSIVIGLFGGAQGLSAFALTQVLWFRQKPLLASLVLCAASWFVNSFLLGLWRLICFQYQLNGTPFLFVSILTGLLVGIMGTLIPALFFQGIVDWFHSRKNPLR